MLRKKAAPALLLAVCVLAAALFAQDETMMDGVDMDALNAAEAFRTGLDAYNRYYFNSAIAFFE